ncbi:MAG TPA: MlaD family protein [Bryobacteraceae bacterium]|nr:MlaD family protein [Bryobacteraceae bacterium]
MRTAERVSWAKLKVGILAIVAMAILGVMIFLLTSKTDIFSERTTVYTYLDDAAALQPGSSVRLNGITIGKVVNVDLAPKPTPNRTVRVQMEIERKYLSEIPTDSNAAVSAENLLGTKFINIKRGTSRETIKPNGEIRALDVQDFDELVRQGYSILASLQGTLKRVDAIVGLVESGQGSIGRLLVDEELYNRLIAIMSEVQKISTALSSPRGTIGKLIYDDALYNDVRQTVARVDGLIVDLQDGKGTAGKLLKDEALYNEIQAAAIDLRKIMADLEAGKGTAGKLLKDEALANQLQASLARVDSLLERLNSGEGTIGQLLVNPALYENINGVTQELNGLLRDFRSNPRKFLRIKLALF